MLAIVPIYLEKTDAVWRSDGGRNLLCRFLDGIRRTDGLDAMMAFTNDAAIESSLKAHHMPAYRVDIKGGENVSGILPKGTDTAVRFARKKLQIDTGRILILNFRNPLLTREIIEEAIRYLKTSASTRLISVKKTEDHPCQLTSYFNIVDLGVIHFFENDKTENFPPDGSRALPDQIRRRYIGSKPFPFGWPKRCAYAKDESGFFSREPDASCVWYNPIETQDLEKHSGLPTLIWQYINEKEARLLFPRKLIDSYLHILTADGSVGRVFGASEPASGVPYLLMVEKGERCHIVLPENESFIDCVFTCMPFHGGGMAKDHWMEFPIHRNCFPVEIEGGAEKHLGLVYAILKYARNDIAELAVPFMAEKSHWRFDRTRGHSVNLITGKTILGRQDFPDVWAPDGTFCICRDEDITSLGEHLTAGHVNGFPLKSSHQVQIHTPLDALRYEAILSRSAKD